MEVLEGDVKAAAFLADNFFNVEFIGAGSFSKVFKANSTNFPYASTSFAVKVLLNGTSNHLSEEDIGEMIKLE